MGSTGRVGLVVGEGVGVTIMSNRETSDFTWLFGGDNVINMQQVRRFRLARNPSAGNRLTVYYTDGTNEYFAGKECEDIWKVLIEASKYANIRPKP